MFDSFPNIRHLRAFKEVAEHQSVSAAAQKVHLSQPAVTQAISGLEKSLEVPLFDRRPEGMFTTPTSQAFLLRVQRMFANLEDGAARAVQAAGKRTRRSDADFFKNTSASQMRALVAIWETGSFSLAARRVGVSQPSIHRAGRELEKLADIPFFQATRRGVELTPAAEFFARGIKLAAAELQQGFDEIALSKGRDSTRISVGSLPLSRTAILPEAIHALMAAHDGVQVAAIDGPYDELLRSLRYGDLDFLIGALRTPTPTDDIVQERLFDDALTVVAGPNHPLVGQENVTLDETLKYPWIAPPRTTPSGSYLFRTLGIGARDSTPVRIVSSSLVLVRGLLSKGEYVTLLSLNQMAVEQDQGLMVPLNVNLPDSTRPIGLTFRKGWHPTPTQASFLNSIRTASRAFTQDQYRQNL